MVMEKKKKPHERRRIMTKVTFKYRLPGDYYNGYQYKYKQKTVRIKLPSDENGFYDPMDVCRILEKEHMPTGAKFMSYKEPRWSEEGKQIDKAYLS